MLETTDLLETFPDGNQGIRGIDGQEYLAPTLAEINHRMVEHRETLETKTKQGFQRIILVPFGLPLATLIEKYRAAIQRHFDDRKLFYTKADAHDQNEELAPITEINADGPLFVWDEYQNADQAEIDPKTGRVSPPKLVYHPKEFSANHGGETKQEIIKVNGGWRILLLEDMPNIPKAGKAKTTAGRTQIDAQGTQIKQYMEAGKYTPNSIEYLNALTAESSNPSSPYFEEQGMTPEDQIIYALTHLEAENQVIDDWQGHGKISWQIGAYFPVSRYVPIADWDRGGRQADLDGNDHDRRNDYYGLRSAVGV